MLHIILDFDVGLFDLREVSVTEVTTLVGVALIQLWWAISFMTGAMGSGSGVASAGILGARLRDADQRLPPRLLPSACVEAWPLTDVAHDGSIAFGILLPLVAMGRCGARMLPGWFLPAFAAALVVGTVLSLANTPIT